MHYSYPFKLQAVSIHKRLDHKHNFPPIATNLKYLESKTCSNCLPSTLTSHADSSFLLYTTTLLLYALIFRFILLHAPTKHPIIILRKLPYSPHSTRSSTYKKSGNFDSLSPLKISLLFFPSILSLLSIPNLFT